jgi:hypothetical protein
MFDLSLITLKHNIFVDAKYNQAKKLIIDRINELNLTDIKYKNDNEFLTFVCNLIENLITKNDKVSKKELAIDIFKQVFQIENYDELDLLRKNVDFICNQGTLVKKLSYYKLFKVGIREWFRKK